MTLNPGTILIHLVRAVRAQEVRSRRASMKKGGEAEAGAKREIGYKEGRREVEVEKGKEAEARREGGTGAKIGAGEEVGAETKGGAEIRGVGVEIDGGGKRADQGIRGGGRKHQGRAQVRKNWDLKVSVVSGHHLLPLVRDCHLIFWEGGRYYLTELGRVINYMNTSNRFD